MHTFTTQAQQGCKNERLIQFLEKVSRGSVECLTHFLALGKNDLLLDKENNNY